jgi:hypothetical protein
LKKIVGIEPYSDGIALRRSNKQKTEYFVGIDQGTLNIRVDERQYSEPFSGLILMYLIQGLMKRLKK